MRPKQNDKRNRFFPFGGDLLPLFLLLLMDEEERREMAEIADDSNTEAECEYDIFDDYDMDY